MSNSPLTYARGCVRDCGTPEARVFAVLLIFLILLIRFTAKHVVSGIAGKWGDLPLFVDITMGDYHIPLLAHVVKDLIPIFELPDMSSPLLP